MRGNDRYSAGRCTADLTVTSAVIGHTHVLCVPPIEKQQGEIACLGFYFLLLVVLVLVNRSDRLHRENIRTCTLSRSTLPHTRRVSILPDSSLSFD